MVAIGIIPDGHHVQWARRTIGKAGWKFQNDGLWI
jgi:hypothetical protein